MVAFYASETHSYLTDYGCVGRGHFNTSEPAVGVPKDGVDSSFMWWKKCIHCAKMEYNNLTFQYNADQHDEFYNFDEVDEQSCRKLPYLAYNIIMTVNPKNSMAFNLKVKVISYFFYQF